jgi:plasmid stabilization system protein ParE
MLRRVRVSAEAASDLRHIKAWFKQAGAGPAASSRLDRLIGQMTLLAQHPCSPKRVDASGVRQLVSERHRLMFRVSPDTGDNTTAVDVFIIRIFGRGQIDD